MSFSCHPCNYISIICCNFGPRLLNEIADPIYCLSLTHCPFFLAFFGCRAYGLRTDLFVYLFPYVIYPLHQGRKRERDQWGGEFYSCTMAENLEGANFNLVCISDHFRAAMNLDQKPALEWHWKYTKICLKPVLNPNALSEDFFAFK